jgi:hypothetical protein
VVQQQENVPRVRQSFTYGTKFVCVNDVDNDLELEQMTEANHIQQAVQCPVSSHSAVCTYICMMNAYLHAYHISMHTHIHMSRHNL